MVFDPIRNDVMQILERLELTNESAAIRPGLEAKLVFYILLLYLTFINDNLREDLEKRSSEIENSLTNSGVKFSELKSAVRNILL